MSEVVKYEPLKAVEVRRDMLAMPAIMAALSADERVIFSASTGRTIAEYGDDKNLIQDVAAVLRYASKDVGIKGLSDAELGYLAVRVGEVMRRYYRAFSVKDVATAFEICITGGLDDYLPKGSGGGADRGHYQSFSLEYICKVLDAYKKRRAAVLGKARALMPEPVRKASKEEIAESSARALAALREAYEFYCDNGRMPALTPIQEMLFHEMLSARGLCAAVEVTEAEQEAILRRTFDRYSRAGNFYDARRIKDAGRGADEIQAEAYALARRKAIFAAFEEMAHHKVRITD